MPYCRVPHGASTASWEHASPNPNAPGRRPWVTRPLDPRRPLGPAVAPFRRRALVALGRVLTWEAICPRRFGAATGAASRPISAACLGAARNRPSRTIRADGLGPGSARGPPDGSGDGCAISACRLDHGHRRHAVEVAARFGHRHHQFGDLLELAASKDTAFGPWWLARALPHATRLNPADVDLLVPGNFPAMRQRFLEEAIRLSALRGPNPNPE